MTVGRIFFLIRWNACSAGVIDIDDDDEEEEEEEEEERGLSPLRRPPIPAFRNCCSALSEDVRPTKADRTSDAMVKIFSFISFMSRSASKRKSQLKAVSLHHTCLLLVYACVQQCQITFERIYWNTCIHEMVILPPPCAPRRHAAIGGI